VEVIYIYICVCVCVCVCVSVSVPVAYYNPLNGWTDFLEIRYEEISIKLSMFRHGLIDL
jgi:hypothetical protein